MCKYVYVFMNERVTRKSLMIAKIMLQKYGEWESSSMDVSAVTRIIRTAVTAATRTSEKIDPEVENDELMIIRHNNSLSNGCCD